MALKPDQDSWKHKIYTVIFEAETRKGRLFDVALLILITVSVGITMLESISSVQKTWGIYLIIADWFITILFTIEYILRLLCTRHPLRYARSFFGVIDLLAILPAYLELFFPEARLLSNIRILRMLRVFRVLKLARYFGEARQLQQALQASQRKIIVFLAVVISLSIILGTLMYLVEGKQHGFTSIPTSIYWAIVTLTTVGFGDITPETPLGQFLASMVMITGYGIIAVPTGIVSAELARIPNEPSTRTCPNCLTDGHIFDASFCKDCGEPLPPLEISDVITSQKKPHNNKNRRT
jgi:voltage-gated potassium channel